MRFTAFFSEPAARAVRRSGLCKFAVLVAVSGGGVVAYADASSNHTEFSQGTPKKKLVVLGTGWAGTSFLKNLDTSLYDVRVVSPRNYFAFTPLLPSVTCGTVEPRSIVEPIRSITQKKTGPVGFFEAECYKIDPANKKVLCRSSIGTNLDGNGEFELDYDYLVVALGAKSNTFNTPGVTEHCHFLKEIEDAQRIRRSVMDCFEKASLPSLSEEERKKNLHFIVVGGGPTGVEFSAALHDFIKEDLSKLYPDIKDLVKISLIEAADRLLTMFDKRITEFAEEKFKKDGIDVKMHYKVVKVSDKAITMTNTAAGEVNVPYGMVVWSTGIGTRPIMLDLMKEIGQGDRRVLATDEWLRVLGCENVYALGDCATITQRKVMEDICAIFKVAGKGNSGTLTVKEIKDVLDDIIERYPQVALYMKTKQMKDFSDLLKDSEGDSFKESVELDVERFKKALAQVDSKVKILPATAQVAAQEGEYLARCFNKMKKCEEKPEGPPRIRGTGRHRFKPFRYRHFGQFAPLGGGQTAAQLPYDWISIGHSTQWLWYSVYASKQVSWRTRFLVISDWMRKVVFGRDSSCI
ncbi:external alternative NAD(P)H-ubiquinone oxidoreductase B3, mitochondrial-like [Phalaenopsis equestris]|uniref:external alternative NAD(P)H-ubiquinone oxidoreductase B3, mitochondrial-like n=1 Tax=Phalaenopsis equestris TaxID=78828 RepID=UPI0009E254D5|nr:external alternative NAD(P)H-ubiquinone oxidoreductase B3, mitochondrial-like [Phalaenopsis equestris]